ncbi:MAG TPA: Rieske (2Fe-2S) protein [Solirubrobacteraceae bacterium]|nr:Rieske (2Fe-2S) protein [Solirubrobacteraceae bacterium]
MPAAFDSADAPTLANASWESVGAVDSFAEGVPIEVQLGDRSIAVIRIGDSLHAMRNRCPHQGAPLCPGRFGGTMVPSAPNTLEYGLEGEIIRCPWHGWEFHVPSGEAVFGISTRRLLKYQTQVHDGDLYVLVPSLRPRPTRM